MTGVLVLAFTPILYVMTSLKIKPRWDAEPGFPQLAHYIAGITFVVGVISHLLPRLEEVEYVRDDQEPTEDARLICQLP